MNPKSTTASGLPLKVIVSLVVSGSLLAYIFSSIDTQGLLKALGRAAPLALTLAFLSFGLAILAGSFRWRVGLRLAAVPMGLGTMLRASYAGHAFNLMLFGPAGGDVAKTSLYSRWYGLPLTDLVASAVMDRSLSVLGSLFFLVVTLGLFLLGGGVVSASALTLDPQAFRGGLIAAVVLGLAIILVSRLRHHPFLHRLGHSLRKTLRAGRDRPGMLLRGGLLGLLGQATMSMVMALGLWAVSEAEISWWSILWTFPLITSVAALPASVGGAGVREGVAILLLARVGIPAEDLVAAGLINLFVQLAWGLIGGAVISWEVQRSKRPSEAT